MVIERGTIWWADPGEPRGAAPGYRRPVVVVQSDAFNRSRIGTVVAVALTTNLRLLEAPGNVHVSARLSGLRKDSVANVSQFVTLDRRELTEPVGRLDAVTMKQLDAGLRLVLSL